MNGCGHCGFSGQLVHKGNVVAERESVDAGNYGASGQTLVNQLQDLAHRGRIPAGFDEMATQLRHLGNLGAHVSDVEVESNDVPVIEDFAEAILEYLYRSPAKVEAVRQALEERRRT